MKLSNSLTLAAILTTAACEQTSTPANLHVTATVESPSARNIVINTRSTVSDCLADQRFLGIQQKILLRVI